MRFQIQYIRKILALSICRKEGKKKNEKHEISQGHFDYNFEVSITLSPGNTGFIVKV